MDAGRAGAEHPPAFVKHEFLDELTPEAVDVFVRELGPDSNSPLVSARTRVMQVSSSANALAGAEVHRRYYGA